MDHLAARQAAGFRGPCARSKCWIEHVDVDGHVERACTDGPKDPVHDRLVSLHIDILGGERTFDDGGMVRDVVVGGEGATDPHLEYVAASDESFFVVPLHTGSVRVPLGSPVRLP